ncbi:Ger(x)C family spore germination protein [Bacillus sp. 3255]|uniref:Ger(x)C family spore germination protein n=1 Tax=Bacillus sp. 3255 TaxID=2817904 RepID=UPI0028637CC6|nr:Ger(x)C family spore germination protein [Bacillus sp. 3255]MDR6881069.1 Ger(x)C family germination protein [Bacillus sp. 3255]
MKRRGFFGLFAVLLLAGCNYHADLKNLQLIYATSLDTNENNEIVTTVTIQSPGGEERTVPIHEVLSASGPTMQDALYKKIGLQISGPIGTSKNQVMLISDKLAKTDLLGILDSTFRSSTDPMLAKVAIVHGTAADLVKLDRIGSATAGEYLRKILKSAQYETMVPKVTVHSIYPALHDQGKDIVIPILRKGNRLSKESDKDKAVIDGLALIHKRKYSGYALTPEQSSLFLLMNGSLGKICVLTRQIEKTEGKSEPTDFLSLSIASSKRSKKVTVLPSGQIQVNMQLKLKANVIEYAKFKLLDRPTIERLNDKFSELLTQESQDICKLLKRAHSDAFGIGRDLIAMHPQEWKRLDWETAYPETDFQVAVKVEIVAHGIIN